MSYDDLNLYEDTNIVIDTAIEPPTNTTCDLSKLCTIFTTIYELSKAGPCRLEHNNKVFYFYLKSDKFILDVADKINGDVERIFSIKAMNMHLLT